MPAYAFNSNGVEPQYGGGGGGLPATHNGQPIKHPVVITSTALKPTKNNDGGYLEIEMTAIDGPYKGSTQTDRLNLHNKSAQAVEIANKQLSAYCHVTGKYAFQNTEELHNIPFMVETKPRSDNATQFEVAKLYDANGNEPGKSGSGAPAGGGGNAWGGGGGAPAGDQGQQQGGGNAWGGQQGGGQQGGGAAPSGGGNGGGWSQGGGGGAPSWGNR